MTSFMIFLLFISLLRYNGTEVKETGENSPPWCRLPTPAGGAHDCSVGSMAFLRGGKETSTAGRAGRKEPPS
jgi:hypothetical protein